MKLTAPSNKKFSKLGLDNGVAQNALRPNVKQIYRIDDIYKVDVHQLVAILNLLDIKQEFSFIDLKTLNVLL